MDDTAKKRLNSVLERSAALKTVYQHKLSLQKIWQRSNSSQETLLNSLEQWCKEAEATGIKRLQDFALTLRGYALGTPTA